jgi:hypothetical protein
MNEDLQSYLKKIRSDAAECLVLGSIVANEKREVFIRTAEHLNGLASELEKLISKIEPDGVGATGREEKAHLDLPAGNVTSPSLEHAEKRSRVLPWLSGMVLGAIFATLALAINPSQTYWSAINAKHDLAPLPHDNPNQAMALLLFSSEQAERRRLSDQIAAIAGRLSGLESSLDDLKKVHAEVGQPINTASIPAKAPIAETSPSAVEKSVSTVESTLEDPTSPKQYDSAGPRGCNLFRSFDPRSGTYVTLDGRRRQCR